MAKRKAPLKRPVENKIRSFAGYKADGANWVTLASGEYYPDILPYACKLYQPVLEMFKQLVESSESSARLFMQIADVSESWLRVQLARVFRKYVSPETPVEMLKKKTKAQEICQQFGQGFRPIPEVQAAFSSRPLNDGPGLLLGSMWDDYASLENSWPDKIMVVTLRMVPERITRKWLQS